MAVLAMGLGGSLLGRGIGGTMGFGGIGGQIGWLVGTFVAQMLFNKPKKNEGPRLTDLTVQSSTEGAAIPIAFAGMRIAGNMFWSTGIVETRHREEVSAKGMPIAAINITYTYSASFAIGLCEGEILGVRKIWADGKLIYDVGDGATADTLYSSNKKWRFIRVYKGEETQAADPKMQSVEGVANTPAYRGLAYLMFESFELADYANRIPNITAEVIVSGTGEQPYRVNTWASTAHHRTAVMASGLVVLGRVVEHGSDPADHIIEMRRLDGALVESQIHKFDNMGIAAVGYGLTPVQGMPRIAIWQHHAVGDGADVSAWVRDGVIVTQGISPGSAGSSYYYSMDPDNAVYLGGYIFTQTITNNRYRISRFPVSAALVPASNPDKQLDLQDAGLISGQSGGQGLGNLCKSGGFLWAKLKSAAGPAYDIIKLDRDLNFIEGYNYPAATDTTDVGDITTYGDLMIDSYGLFPGNVIRLWQLTTPELTPIGSDIIHGLNQSNMTDIGSGLSLFIDGVFSLLPNITKGSTTLQAIIEEICELVGLDPVDDIDASELTDVVDGYVIPRQMSARSAIEPLQSAYFFDVVESDGKIKFPKRGQSSAGTIAEDDLGAGSVGSTPEFPLTLSRQQELELPVEITINYMDVDADYNIGTQRSRRLTTPSREISGMDLSIAMTSTKAAQTAEILMRNLWAERERFKFSLSRKWSHLDPADVIAIPTASGFKSCRLVSIDMSPDGLLSCEGVADHAALYESEVPGNDEAVQNPQTIPIPGPTLLQIMDIPLLRDIDDGPGHYWTVTGYTDDWHGMQKFISRDDGSTWTVFGSALTAGTIGFVDDPLGSHGDAGLWDLVNSFNVALSTPDATLSTVTDEDVYNGQNVAVLGDEIIQFATATLEMDGTYTLSRLLRGRRGTEDFIATHVAGERFVLINPSITQRADIATTDLNVERLFRAVSFGEALEEADVIPFTNTGRCLRPYSPVLIKGRRDPTTGGWLFEWTRRGRLDNEWRDLVDVPLGEASEAYEVDVLIDSAVVRTIAVTAASATYTMTEQIADGGGQSEPSIAVYQMSEAIGRGIPGSATLHLPVARWTGTAAPANYYRTIELDAPKAFWSCDGSGTTTLTDESLRNDAGGTMDATWSGTKTVNQTDSPLTNASASRSVLFGGGSATLADSSAAQVLDDITVECWAKWSSSSTMVLIAKSGGPTATHEWQIGTSAGVISFRVRTTSAEITATHSGGYNDSAWHHVVGTRHGDEVKLYTDGVLRDTQTGTGADALIVDTSTALVIGANAAGSAFAGNGTKFALYDSCLTLERIQAHYAAATFNG